MNTESRDNKRAIIRKALLDSNVAAKPFAASNEVIEVVVSTEDLIGDYANTLLAAAMTRHPAAVQAHGLTVEELEDYFRFLIHKRIVIANDMREDTRGLHFLWIPCFLEYALTSLGRVTIAELGITLIPVMEEPISDSYTIEDAKKTSFKLSVLERNIHMVVNAMPREKHGNLDVMMTALIAGEVRAIRQVDDPLAPWISRFIGLKLKEEVQFSALYRISYDDASFIRESLYLNDRIV